MRSPLHPAALSFTIPVPVRSGDFTPLFPEHAAWGVEACPGDIPSFSDNRTLVPDDELLWCDLRFSSRRAGFFSRKEHITKKKDIETKGIKKLPLVRDSPRCVVLVLV